MSQVDEETPTPGTEADVGESDKRRRFSEQTIELLEWIGEAQILRALRMLQAACSSVKDMKVQKRQR
eukprot:TRINITY_DN6335_c0_g1_i1.p3 TRINITY_DN6335_c0_g1~~TRINITY_DN6335_c0_g1_i1.p3  ORF type:complete len:67 (-),score=11.49 TRINITY_DN6335_c0_g1_i1:286-486(-)